MQKTVLTFGLLSGAVAAILMWATLPFLDGIGYDRPRRVHVAVEKKGREILFDFSGSDEQARGPVNVTSALIKNTCYFGLMAMTDAELEAGCALAAKYEVASVCIKPYAVRRAAELLRGSGVAVGTLRARRIRAPRRARARTGTCLASTTGWRGFATGTMGATRAFAAACTMAAS